MAIEIAWSKNGTPDTLGSALDDMDITDLTAKKFNQFMVHILDTGGQISHNINFNNNANSVYAERSSFDGGTDATLVSQTKIAEGTATREYFEILYVCSISGEEKLGMLFWIRNLAGAANAPSRYEQVFKFVPSPDADITRIDYSNTDVGSFDTNSNLSALGTD